MEMLYLILIIIIAIIAIIFLALTFKSSFGNLEQIYQSNLNCFGTDPVNVVPRGHLPGSEIILTNAERRGLLQRFVDNGTDQFI
jgi:hypothetical protein